MFRRIYIYLPELRILHELVCGFRQLSLLQRRHKANSYLQCIDEAQNRAETRVCT